MVMRFSKPVHYRHCSGLEISKTVFHAAIQRLRICRSVYHGTTHVLLGAMHVAIPRK